ncbi:hypothetical protein GCM10023081_22780 [Arthrobacter ginkgonis]|uniref:SCP2 domain-containing protein n=2 Tax=Arthrobacter ginkgonis TaxID=1630594 RepID=A0ABP7CBA9_9MICC
MTTSASGKAPTDDPVAAFFDELARRGYEPLLRKVSGRVRFDLVDGSNLEPRLVVIDKGKLTVTGDSAEAECTIRGELPVFKELVSGRRNFVAAVLRGALACQGDLELMFAIQRIFPAPPRGWDPTADTRSG